MKNGRAKLSFVFNQSRIPSIQIPCRNPALTVGINNGIYYMESKCQGGGRKIGYGQTLHSRKAIEWRQRMDEEGEEQLENP